MNNYNSDSQIIEEKVFTSGFLWKPAIVTSLDYEKLKQTYSFEKSSLFILCGVSTAGKDTLLQKILQTVDITVVPRATSRPPRTGEIEGVDYYFEEMDSFLWSEYAGNIYAVPMKIFPIFTEKKKVLVTNGIVYAPTLKAIFDNLGTTVHILYVLPGKLTDSLEQLQQTVKERLVSREEKDDRTASALRELEMVMKFKNYLQGIGTTFIENTPNPLGYSPKALEQLQTILLEK